jgi:thiamine kinase-like enzyme
MLKHDLVKRDSVIESDLVIRDVSRRNQNFQVASKNGHSYLLKYGGIGKGKTASIPHEAAIYRFFRQMDKAKNNNKKNNSFSSKYLPNFYYYDKREHLLILELFPEAKNLREHYISSCRFSRILAAKVGECLGELHQITYDYLHSRKENNKDPIISDILSDENRLPPAVLSLHKPQPKIFRDISNANIQLIKIVQSQKELCKTLDELHAGWNSHKRYECLIHSDIKSDNFLTVESLNPPDSSSHSSSDMYKKTRHLKLIDWELARIGDPAWDTGCVFSDYLALWLFSLPIINRESSPDSFLKLALHPLHKMQPAIRSSWNSYVRKMRFDVNESNKFLVRSVRYCSAQLVRKAYEYLQRRAKISANIVYLLQVSLNIMKDPQTAMTSLLGISSC